MWRAVHSAWCLTNWGLHLSPGVAPSGVFGRWLQLGLPGGVGSAVGHRVAGVCGRRGHLHITLRVSPLWVGEQRPQEHVDGLRDERRELAYTVITVGESHERKRGTVECIDQRINIDELTMFNAEIADPTHITRMYSSPLALLTASASKSCQSGSPRK